MRGKNKTKHEGPSLGMCTTPQINNKVPSTSSSRRLGSVGPRPARRTCFEIVSPDLFQSGFCMAKPVGHP